MAECRASLGPDCTARGKVLTLDGSDVQVNGFLGVPYAQPPVGELRFSPPKPHPLWRGERDCTEHGGMCPQPWTLTQPVFDPHNLGHLPRMSEDTCLHLNIYTPSLPPAPALPVMVYIHGGAFCIGCSSVYDGRYLAGLHGVVVVTINYRLGVFGFFTTGDDVVPGNNGLLDQVEALRWIQNHIAAFGGNPDNVTIFGESAGGMSCSFHVLSDKSSGLFKRAIIQSGPATSPYAANTPQIARVLMQPGVDAIGYKGTSSSDLVTFLRERSAEELANNLAKNGLIFRPVIDGHFIQDYPQKQYSGGLFKNVEIMIGCVSHEGNSIVKKVIQNPETIKTETEQREYVRAVVGWVYSQNQDAIADKLYERYITADDTEDPDVFIKQFVELYGDMMFRGANDDMAIMHSAKAPVYVYKFAHRPSYSENAAWVGASHAEELDFTFGSVRFKPNTTFSDADQKVSIDMMSYWANFAKTGDPNGSGLVAWSPFEKNHKAVMILQEKPVQDLNMQPELMAFWRDEIRTLDIGRPLR